MKIFRIMMAAFTVMAASLMLTGCGEIIDPITYNNPYAGDWYELEDNGNGTWDAVKLSLSDSTFEISDATFNADGENTNGYISQIKGSIQQLSSNQIYWETKEAKIGENWYSSREDYVSFLIDSGVASATANSTADGYFVSENVYYTIGSNPTTLILGTGIGSGSEYTDMTYFTSVFSAKSGASRPSGF